MTPFKDLLALAVNRKGSLKAVQSQLPEVADQATLRSRDDAWYLSAMTRRVFRAGLKHSLVDNKWPAFEEAFFGFDPEKLVLMPDPMLDERMQDTRLIRHWGKMKAIRHNAQFVIDLAQEYGSVGEWLAVWPTDDTVGMWQLLKKRGKQTVHIPVDLKRIKDKPNYYESFTGPLETVIKYREFFDTSSRHRAQLLNFPLIESKPDQQWQVMVSVN